MKLTEDEITVLRWFEIHTDRVSRIISDLMDKGLLTDAIDDYTPTEMGEQVLAELRKP